MLLILLKDGDTTKVGPHTNVTSLRHCAAKCRAAGYVQYTNSKEFEDESDPWIKRFLLIDGRVMGV